MDREEQEWNINLTPESEEKITNAVERTERVKVDVRWLDHDIWKENQKRIKDAELEKIVKYNKHVKECNWHNRVTTVLFIVITVALLRTVGMI